MTLSEARAQAKAISDERRGIVADLPAEKKATFKSLWADYYAQKAPQLKDLTNIRSAYKRYLSRLDDRPVAALTLKVIQDFIDRLPEKSDTRNDPAGISLGMKHNLLLRLHDVFRYGALIGGYGIDRDPLADFLTSSFNRFKRDRSKHWDYCKAEELPEKLFMPMNAMLPNNPAKLRRCKQFILFLLFTLCRHGEARLIKWTMFHDEWLTIPAEIRKGRKGKEQDHEVWLSPQLKALLDGIKADTDAAGLTGKSEFVFWSVKDFNQPLGTGAVSTVLNEAAPDLTLHGLRASASTYLRDHLREIPATENDVERVLSHKIGNAAALAYDHATYREPKKKVLGYWCSYVERILPEGWRELLK